MVEMILSSPESIRAYFDGLSNFQTQISLSPIIVIASLVLLLLVVGVCFSKDPTKTQKYRQVVSDMYVAATIRKFASEDGLNLDEEYKKYKRFESKKQLEGADVDMAIEANLKDKVTEKTMNEIDSMNKTADKKA